jgi:hypothetical protein
MFQTQKITLNENKITFLLFYGRLLLQAEAQKLIFLTYAAFPKEGMVMILR